MKQYQRPKLPEKWTSDERMFYLGIMDIIDEMYARRIGKSDLDKDALAALGRAESVVVDGEEYALRIGDAGQDGYITFTLEDEDASAGA